MPVDNTADEFIPPRGRKSLDSLSKRNLNLQKLFDKNDLFMPNRGKKQHINHLDHLEAEKRAQGINDVLDSEDLFFPNRGKKQIPELARIPENLYGELLRSVQKRSKINLNLDDFFIPNRGKKNFDMKNLLNDEFYPNRGKKAVLGQRSAVEASQGFDIQRQTGKQFERKRRDLLDNLSKDSGDTFYSARGRRTQLTPEQQVCNFINHSLIKSGFILEITETFLRINIWEKLISD